MKEIQISSYAKINLSLDVTGVMDNGMHQVDMIMQQLSFHDDVTVRFEADESRERGDIDIVLTTSRPYLPTDEKNIAYKAARLMIDEYGRKRKGGTVYVDIFKRIPVAAGMAGGSGNGAAVLHGLNVVWNLQLSLSRLCSLGAELGSDVPFCVMGQAKGNRYLPKKVRKDSMAESCARALGTGTELIPVRGLKKAVVLAKPRIGVSTREVYQGIDDCVIRKRPDTDALIGALKTGDLDEAYANFVNVLEEYTLKAYPEVMRLKEIMKKLGNPKTVLMSGSGPTVFAVYDDMESAQKASDILRNRGYESYWTKSTR
ncbi:MAG: 4-(cytidine 5'-diphospho)-2-C-methyl-D-erythritol kinase [Emergencia sp.]